MRCNLTLLTTPKLSFSPFLTAKRSLRPATSSLSTRSSYTMASNTAAWLVSEKAHPLQVKAAPLYTPGENEILVRNHAVAINPIDGLFQSLAIYPLNYPTILGHDVAGEVVDVGPNVTAFKPGTRVIGQTVGMSTHRDQDNAFQAYTILQTNLVSEIPDEITYETAAVIPLGLSTASAALFQPTFLNLQFPSEPAASSTGQTLLIWGGSSSVGSNAIQLAVAAGYAVITTASPRNFSYVKKLGASEAVDHSSPTVVDDLVAAFHGKTLAGAFDCTGGSGWAGSVGLVHKHQGEGNRFVATTKRGFPDPPEGVTMQAVFGLTIKDNPVGEAIYRDYLPKALKTGSFVPSPEPLVAGKGLESIQTGIDLHQKGGISAKKVVVSL